MTSWVRFVLRLAKAGHRVDDVLLVRCRHVPLPMEVEMARLGGATIPVRISPGYFPRLFVGFGTVVDGEFFDDDSLVMALVDLDPRIMPETIELHVDHCNAAGRTMDVRLAGCRTVSPEVSIFR